MTSCDLSGRYLQYNNYPLIAKIQKNGGSRSGGGFLLRECTAERRDSQANFAETGRIGMYGTQENRNREGFEQKKEKVAKEAQTRSHQTR